MISIGTKEKKKFTTKNTKDTKFKSILSLKTNSVFLLLPFSAFSVASARDMFLIFFVDLRVLRGEKVFLTWFPR